MSGLFVDPDGRTWVTSERGAASLGVNRALIWTWAHRYRDQITRVEVLGVTWYRLDHLRAAEKRSDEKLTRQSAKRVDA